MAQAFLRYGRNEQLRRIAQEIIVEQQQEIPAMRLALGDSPLPPAASPDLRHPLPVRRIRKRRLMTQCTCTRSPDMKRRPFVTALLGAAAVCAVQPAFAGQAPGAASDPDVPISHRDRVYAGNSSRIPFR